MAWKGLHLLDVASAGFAAFLATQVLLHVRNLHEWPRHISSFVYLGWGWLWTLGILAQALGMAALALGLQRLLPRVVEARWAVASLGTAAVAVLVMAAFPTDVTDYPSTPIGYIHDFAAVVAVTVQCAAMFYAVLAARADPLWRLAVGPASAWPWIAAALGVAWCLGDITPWWPAAALVQRLLGIAMVGWMLALSWRVRVEVLAPTVQVPVQGIQRAR